MHEQVAHKNEPWAPVSHSLKGWKSNQSVLDRIVAETEGERLNSSVHDPDERGVGLLATAEVMMVGHASEGWPTTRRPTTSAYASTFDREVDAFSFWHENRPFVFLNASKSAERLRFDLAHELGHLCIHRDVRTNRNRQYELDANTFASTLLMPADGLIPQLVGSPSLPDVMELKAYWKVSATAMVRRLHQLKRISDWQYRTWMIDLSERGFRTSEPNGVSREQSALLRQVLALAREDGWRTERISKELGIPRRDFTEAFLGLTVMSVSTGMTATPSSAPTAPSGPPQLRAVR
ncbi:ImmA/IrrE family metallo-endopeptidase [Micromonospora arborensis]|uniref:ImmA/IrrE family metallo-endopeptidase n=1 Tax=Micromonospora arborensis TaxID=2116518 RepID=UPI0034444F4C